MTYYIYSDSASNDSGVGCAYYIRTATEYLCSGGKMFQGYKIASGETIAIGLGLASLYKRVELKSDDMVVVLTDSRSAMDYYQKFVETQKIPSKDKRIIASLSIFADIAFKCKVVFCKVKAHQDELSENTFTDRYAKLVLNDKVS